jgi:hypothetical protein
MDAMDDHNHNDSGTDSPGGSNGPTPPRKPGRSLSEISHLFLSSIRDAAGEDRRRPNRLPPGANRSGVNRPGSEHAEAPHAEGLHDATDLASGMIGPMSGDELSAMEAFDGMEDQSTRRRVTAVVTAHGDAELDDHVARFAGDLARNGARVGVVFLDSADIHIWLADAGDAPTSVDPEEGDVLDHIDARRISETLNELNHDVDRWLLVLPEPRRPEARTLLQQTDDWVLLMTADHDGIVAGYRTLKGLADGPKSPLSVALLDAASDDVADRVFAKLSGVCRQFLDWDVSAENPVSPGAMSLVPVLSCHGGHDKAQLATLPHWRAVDEFLGLPPDENANAAHFGNAGSQPQIVDSMSSQKTSEPKSTPAQAPQPEPKMNIAQTTTSDKNLHTISAAAGMAMMAPAPQMEQSASGVDEVVEMIDGAGVVSTVLGRSAEMIATPVRVPMFGSATVAVGRDRGLMLVAEIEPGLRGVEGLSAAVKWLDDSRSLIAMAMPQVSIDASMAVRVVLWVDYADRAAESVRSLIGTGRVTIRTYRRLRWAGRTGLLLDAA